MNIDPSILALLGISAIFVPTAGSIVNVTVNNIRKNFDLEGKQLFAICYALSMFLVMIMIFLTPPEVITFGSIFLTLGRIILTGWLTGNYAAMMADTATRARQEDPPKPLDRDEEWVV